MSYPMATLCMSFLIASCLGNDTKIEENVLGAPRTRRLQSACDGSNVVPLDVVVTTV